MRCSEGSTDGVGSATNNRVHKVRDIGDGWLCLLLLHDQNVKLRSVRLLKATGIGEKR
jgi:hypothetical protein